MRTLRTLVLLLAGAVAVLSAQAPSSDVVVVQRDYDMMRLTAGPSLDEPVRRGRATWLQRCAFCHDGLGTPTYQTMGPWIDRDTLTRMGEPQVREKVAAGSARMPGFRHGLVAGQVDEIVGFLRTVSPEGAPTPDQRNRAAAKVLRAVRPPDAPAPVAPADALLRGTVRIASGTPLDGAAVSVKAPGQTITTSVYTDTRGVFVFPALPAGRYDIWAQAAGFRDAHATVTLDPSGPVTQALSLASTPDFAAQLTGDQWLDALPSDTREHRRMKQVLFVSCADCHSLAVVLQNRFDEAGWRAVVRSMEEASHTGWSGRLDPKDEQLGFLGAIIRHHREDLTKYLTEMRGPSPSPMTLTVPARPRGEAARVVITEYDIPIGERQNELAWHNGANWADGPAVGMHGIVGPHDVATDASGAAWVIENRTSFETNRTLVRLDPSTGQMRAVTLTDAEGKVFISEQIAQDQSGRFWFHFGGRLGRLDPSAVTLDTFAPARGMGPFMNSNDVDSRGRVWTNGLYGSFRFDPATRTFRLFQQATPADGTTYGVAADAEDNGWWSGFLSDIVTKVDATTGRAWNIPMRDPLWATRRALMTRADLDFYASIGSQSWGSYPAGPVPFASAPRRLAADKKGSTVWVPNWGSGVLAGIDIHTRVPTYYPLPVSGHAYSTRVDGLHNVYTDVPNADAIVKLNPSTKQWTVFRLPSHGCGSRHMWWDEARGEAWLPCDQSSRVARFQFRSAAQVAAQNRVSY
ncbi:MAG: carboxypeptidase regulatory-like domain-containing protein [Vicinamibacterales bacterium]